MRRIAPKDAAMRLGAHMTCFNPSDIALLARAWAAIGSLVNAVPTVALAYPREYDRLSDVAARLPALLSDHVGITA